MKTQEKLVLAKNAVANIFRGGAAAVVALVLPPFLTRYMSTAEYGIWSLILQLAAYIGYLDFGLQTAVGRYVAHATERRDFLRRDQIASTSFACLSLSGMCGFAILSGVAFFLPRFFTQMPMTLLFQARVALLLVAGSLALSLPFAVFNGIFVGLQRNEIPAVVIAGARLISTVATVVLARHGFSLVVLAATMALINIASYLAQYGLCAWLAPDVKISRKSVVVSAARELFGYCKSLTIWAMAMLVVSSTGIVLVGLFRFQDAAYYAVAASLVTFIVGIQNSVFNAMIPSAAVLGARNDGCALGRMLVTATRYGMLLLLLTGVPLIFFSRQVLRLWVGPVYAANAAPILQILLSANIVRLSTTPYSVTLIGTGQQRFVIFPPILESVINFMVSILGGYLFGTAGVALGALVGAITGMLAHWFYGLPRITGIVFDKRELLRSSVLKPLMPILPALGGYAVYSYVAPTSRPFQTGLFLLVLAVFIESLRRFGLTNRERQFLGLRRLLEVLRTTPASLVAAAGIGGQQES